MALGVLLLSKVVPTHRLRKGVKFLRKAATIAEKGPEKPPPHVTRRTEFVMKFATTGWPIRT